MLENIFLTIINMSTAASIAAVIIILLRMLIGRKIPKTFHYAAWGIVLIRLLVPFSVPTSFSLFNFIPSNGGEIRQQINMTGYEVERVSRNEIAIDGTRVFHRDANASGEIDDRVNVIDDETDNETVTDSTLPQNWRITSDNNINKQRIVSVIAYIWLVIFLILIVFGIYAYLKTCRRLKTAVLFNDNGLVNECSSKLNFKRKIKIYTSEKINTPVVAGIINVRIIIPAFLVNKSDSNHLKYVIIHELVHIKRYDNITKLLAFFVLCIHWFNPLIWISFLLSQKDMEMSCDIKVLSAYKSDIRSDYANSLLNIAAKQNALIHGGLLAFGESSIRDRIKGIMKFKKSGRLIKIIATFMLVALGFILLTNRQTDDTDRGKSAVADNTYLNEQQEFNNEKDEFSELKAYAKVMEDLLANSNFQYMTEGQMEEVLNTLPEIVRDNYRGIGRIESSGSGYILLKCKKGAKGLPEGTRIYEVTSISTKLSQKVLEDSQGDEICRFPTGMYVNYYNNKDIFFIAVGEKSANMSQIMQIEVFQLSGLDEYIRYAKQAKERGSFIFNSEIYPRIAVSIMIDGISPIEYVQIAETFAKDMKEKLYNLEKIECDTNTLVRTGIEVQFDEDDENFYELCLLSDGTKVIHKHKENGRVIIDHDIYDSIMNIVKAKTAWEWVELSEIHDIVRAEMRMKLGRNSEEQVQVVEDAQNLKELENMFSNAKYCDLTGCPFTAKILLTRRDGKIIALQIATDSCDTMILGTSAAYDYGPEPRGPGVEGTVNRQEVLKRIFDKINWERK